MNTVDGRHGDEGFELIDDKFFGADGREGHWIIFRERVQFSRAAFDFGYNDCEVLASGLVFHKL